MCDLQALIASAVSEKKFVRFGEASKAVLGTGKYLPSHTGRLIRLFDATVPGASALLVNAEGQFSELAPVEQHRAWLQERGYTTFPAVHPKTVRKDKSKVDQNEIDGLKAQIAALTALVLVRKAA